MMGGIELIRKQTMTCENCTQDAARLIGFANASGKDDLHPLCKDCIDAQVGIEVNLPIDAFGD